MKKALIFGVTGQDGSYLSEILLEKGYEVHGVKRRTSSYNTSRIDHIFNNKNFKLHYGDVTDSLNVTNLIQTIKPDEIYNLSAQSISSDSLCPIMTAQGISYRTLESVWDEQVSKNKTVDIVNTDEGEVEVINLPENTQMKALGYWNGMGSWFKIKQISRHWYTGQICNMKQKFGSIKVTPNHSILDVNQKIRMPAENPWLLNVRKVNYNRNIKREIELRLDGRYEKDDEYFWMDENGKCGKVKRTLSDETLYHFCKFIGAYVAEGHITYNKANNSYFIGISEQRKEWLEDLKVSLMYFFEGNTCFVRHKKEGFDDVWELQIKSRALYSLLKKLCGENSKTRKLPDWVFCLDDSNLRVIFDKMIEGDGCYTDIGGYRYTTSSYNLACQFSMLNTFLGYDYTVNEEENGAHHFRECKQYQITQGDHGKKVEMLDYNGYVYDISVDEVCNFTTGVGNIVVHNSHVKVSFEIPEYTGNVDALGTLRILESIRLLGMENDVKFYQASTSELYGLVQEIPQKETTPFYPRSPYGCFPKGTKVLVKSKKEKPVNKNIEDIQIGDFVYAFNENTHEKEYDEVIDVMTRKTDELFKIRFSNGNYIDCTEEHPFYVVGKGWVDAKDLDLNDECIQYKYSGLNLRTYQSYRGGKTYEELYGEEKAKHIKEKTSTSNTEIVKITSIEKVTNHCDVFNITTKNNHNYFAYGVLVHNCAKLYGFWILKNYREAYNIFACNGILYNHESPRRGETFVTQKIVMGLNSIKNKQSKVLRLGNLNSLRDWGHAKDFCEAMHLMLQQDKPDDYVVATGEQYSVRQFVEKCAPYFNMNIMWVGEGLNEVGIDKNTGDVVVSVDASYFRPTEVETLLGDATKARTVLGWKPKHTFEDLVHDMCQSELSRTCRK